MTDWPAPVAQAPLHAVVEVPGSKSLTNRLLVLAALADGPSTIRGALRSRDADLMIAALRQLGVGIAEGVGGSADVGGSAGATEPTTLHVRPPDRLRGGVAIDTGLAGTVMRFLPPVAALADGPVTFDGDRQARERPMAALLAALSALGVGVRRPDDPGDDRAGSGGEAAPGCREAAPVAADAAPGNDEAAPGCRDAARQYRDAAQTRLPTALPFTIAGLGAVTGGAVDIDASASSQFVSALLLAAPRFANGLTLRHVGGALPSLPHIEMTVAALREAGVTVDDTNAGRWRVEPGPIKARDVRVEPDLSNSLPFLAAALVAGGTAAVPGWPQATTQPGGLVPQLLTQLGGQHRLEDGVLTVTGTGAITPVDLDLSAAGELAPNIAVLCALADGTSRLRGIAHLRGHETDRLAALVAEINRLGGEARELADGLEIVGHGPNTLHGGLFRTYHDHRMATSGALLGLRVPGVVVENVETTAKTMPGFAASWDLMLSQRPSDRVQPRSSKEPADAL